MKKILAVIFCLITGTTFAQSGNIGFLLAFPQAEFKENVKQTGIGIGFDAVFFQPRPEAPFAFGVSASFLTYGSEDRTVPFSSTIPDVRVNVDRKNNIGSLLGLFRLSTNNTLVRPYMDILVGGSYLFTETTIESRFNDKEVVSDTNFDDFAFNYGAGAGILYKIFDTDNAETNQKINFFLDLRVRYIFGSRAEYLKEGSIIITPQGTATYTSYKSKTDLLQAQIGLFAQF